MTSQSRLIRIRGQEIWITPDCKILTDQTNLPSSMGFKQMDQVFWKVDITDYDSAEEKVTIQVLDYYPDKTQSFKKQKLKSPIKSLHFDPLDWAYLEPFLSYYKKNDLLEIIIDSDRVFRPDESEIHYSLTLKVLFKDLSYETGYVSYHTFIEQVNQEVEVQIENPFIIPEFQFIKSFFARKIRRKYVDVDIDLLIKGSRVTEVKATSKQIDKINDTFIGTIKYSRFQQLAKEPLVTAIDKSLFTADEFFDEFAADEGGNIFNQDATNIIQLLTAFGSVRNRKQLEYLSGLKQISDYKVHLTLQPKLGFLFLLRGNEMYHFCWELLNSHATYLWSFDGRDDLIPGAFKRIERIIQRIRDYGRDRYRRSVADRQETDSFVFHSIVHQHADSKVRDPFPLWRQRLEEKLT